MPPLPTPLDEHLYDPTAQMIKVILPYMDVSSARMMAVLAKFLEIKRTIIFFNKPYFSQNICKGSLQSLEITDILCDLKKYCDGPHLQMIDMLLNAHQMSKMYEKFKDMENHPLMKELMQQFNPESQPQKGEDASMDMNDLLKNVDMNKFNQMLSALQQPQEAAQNPSAQSSSQQNSSAPPNIDALKSMLTPEQKKMFENLSQNLFQNK